MTFKSLWARLTRPFRKNPPLAPGKGSIPSFPGAVVTERIVASREDEKHALAVQREGRLLDRVDPERHQAGGRVATEDIGKTYETDVFTYNN